METQYQKFRSITLKQLVYTLVAADEGGVSAAARKLHVSQPAISAAIAALEAHYGNKVFTRLPAQGVALTTFGRKVIAEIRLLADQMQIVSQLATPEAQVSGEVGICCYDAVAPFVIPSLLRRLEAFLPHVSVRLQEANLQDTAASLRQGKADLAISYEFDLEPKVYKQTLYTLSPQILCATDHVFAKQAKVALEQLHQEKLILLDQPMSAQYILGLIRSRGVEPEVVRSVKTLELQRALVANGFGIALAHTVPQTQMSYDGVPVKVIPIADGMAKQRVQVTCMEQNRNRPILKAVLEHLEQLF